MNKIYKGMKEDAIREALKFYKKDMEELKVSGATRFMLMNFARKSIEIYKDLLNKEKE